MKTVMYINCIWGSGWYVPNEYARAHGLALSAGRHAVIVPEPFQAGCHPVEDEVGVRVNTGRWGTNSWARIEDLAHPHSPDPLGEGRKPL